MARKQVEDAESAIMQELKDMTTTKNRGATTGNPKTTFQEMLHAIGDSLSDLPSSDTNQDGEDEEDDEEVRDHGKQSDDDEPGWVMGTISKTVKHHRECFRQRQMRLDKLTKPGWEDAANYVCERDVKYGTAALKVLVVVKPQVETFAATPSPTTFGEHMPTLDIIGG